MAAFSFYQNALRVSSKELLEKKLQSGEEITSSVSSLRLVNLLKYIVLT